MSEPNVPLISVVIPNYNNGPFLIECLESVLVQTYKNIEIILVDDGSTDNSLQVLLSFQDRISLITTENRGPSAARNTGILNAKGEFIAFLDSDDIWEPTKLKLQMEMMLGGDYDLIYCSSRDFFLTGVLGNLNRAQFTGNCYKYFKQYPASDIISLGCNSALLRVTILRESGLFDESFFGAGEDWDFSGVTVERLRLVFCQMY